MPRNGSKPTPKDLIAELAAREDGVTRVQGHISGIAGPARGAAALAALHAPDSPISHCSRARRARCRLPCVCRRLSEDEDRGMEGPVQLHLGPAQPAAAPLQEGDSRELVRGRCRDRADARGRVGGAHVGSRAKTAPSEVGRRGVARVSARSCVCEHLWHLCVGGRGVGPKVGQRSRDGDWL